MKILRVTAVAEKTTLSIDSIWRYVRAGNFPKPFKLGPNTTVWDEADVDTWIAQRKERSNDESNRPAD